MLDGAYVEICGYLSKDIVITENKAGNKYGMLSLAVKKKSETRLRTQQSIYKIHHYCVYIWDKRLLENQSSYYKKGERVLVIGELDVIRYKENKSTDNEAGVSQAFKSTMVINVKRSMGVRILPKEMPSSKPDSDNSMLPSLEADNQHTVSDKPEKQYPPNKTARFRKKKINFFSLANTAFLGQDEPKRAN